MATRERVEVRSSTGALSFATSSRFRADLRTLTAKPKTVQLRGL